jgi:SRSO17 transposase
VLGDEVYGSDHKLRAALERREQAYVLTVRSNEQVWAVRAKKTGWDTAAELAAACPASAWHSHSAGAGTKGERVYDWARVPLARRGRAARTHWQHWLLIRRHRQDPDDVAYYVVFAPANTSLATLARVAGMRWTVEECFEVAKQEVGLDEYEVRSWQGWYRHITLAMLALAFLVAMRVKLNASPPQSGDDAPSRPLVDLSVCEIRHLISRLLLTVGLALEPIFAWSFWRRMHQAVAKLCHWKARGLCPA